VTEDTGLHGWARRATGFLGVGAFATALQYVILLAGVELLGASPVVASATGFTVSAVANYLLNYRYTFRSRRRHVSAALRFALVAAAGLLLTAGLMEVLAHRAGLPYLWAQVLTTGVVLVFNFTAHALWSFAKESE
jgi:putative flippase GtrA